MRLLVCLSVLFFLIGGILSAEDQEPEEPAYQITVTGDRLEESIRDKTDSITVITREEIEAHQWNFVLDAIRQAPGITVVQSGSPGKVSSVFLRGAGSAQAMVMLDGVQINNPYFGGVNLEDIPTDQVERIEILRGPQSPLYGSDSMAGVIHIITRKGSGKGAVSASFEGGSFDTFREKASVSGKQDNLDYSISFSRQDTNGQTANDEFAETTFIANGGYDFSKESRFSFTGQIYDSETGIPFRFSFDPVTFLPGIELSPRQNQNGSLSLISTVFSHNEGSLVNLNTRFSYIDRNFHFEDPDSFFPSSDNSSNVFQAGIQNDFRLGTDDTFTAGYEFEYQDVKAEDAFSGPYPLTDTTNHALFAQNKWDADKWIVTAGFRYDHYSTFGDTVNPRVSAGYRITEDLKVRGSAGTGFRAPSAGDLGLPFYGNPNLKPEKSYSWETGVDYYYNMSTTFSVSWFHNSYDDLITFDPNTFIAGNVAEAMTQGLELSGFWKQAGWTISGSYTYLDSEDETTGQRLYRRSEHSGSLQLMYDASRWGTAFNLLANGDRLESDFLQVPSANVLNPGYTKLDLAAYYSIQPWLRLKGRIENLTDESYEEALYYQALDRSFYGGVEVKF